MARTGLGRFQRAAASAWASAAGRARNADWGAILFELLLIVTGILIAFQLDRFAERWKRSHDRQLYVERLAEEATANVERLHLSVATMKEDTEELRQLLTAIGDPAARDRLPPGIGCGLLRLPAIRLQTAAMAEYSDTGSLELAADPQLRQRINSAAAGDAYAASQLEYFRDSFILYLDRLLPFTENRFDPRSGKVSCRLDVEAIAADPDAASLLAAIYTDRTNFESFRSRQFRDHKALHQRICELHRNCPKPDLGPVAPDPPSSK